MAGQLNAVSLFAGIGGFEIALQRAGVDVVAAVEIDDAARGVIAHRLPHVNLFTDVQEVNGDDLRAAGFQPDTGVLTGGFPCQDLSVAGQRAGLAGGRSSLFWEITRLIEETGPRWVVLENVPGLLSSHGGRDMGVVLGALVERGYGVSYRVLDAQHFGVPQRRRRVVIVGCAGDADGRASADVLALSEGMRGDPAPRREKGQNVAGTLGGGSGNRGWSPDTDRMTFIPVAVGYRHSSYGGTAEGIGPITSRYWRDGHDGIVAFNHTQGLDVQPSETSFPTLRSGGSGNAVCEPLAVSENQRAETRLTPYMRSLVTGGGHPRQGYPAVITDVVRRLTPRECERLQGFPDDWTAERYDFKKGRVVAQADGPRYRQLGNAVAVPVFEWVLNRLVAVDAEERQVAA